MTRRFSIALALVGLLALLCWGLVACDSTGTPTVPPPTPTLAAPSPIATGLPAPVPSAGVVRVAETPDVTPAISPTAVISPTVTPTPEPIPIPTDFNALFWLLFLGGGAFFSAVAPWVIDRVADLWIYAQANWAWFAWLPELTPERKRFLSIFVPAGLVLAGWLGLTLDGALPLTEQNFFLLLSTMFEVATGKQIVFGIGQSIKAGAERRLRRLEARRRAQP